MAGEIRLGDERFTLSGTDYWFMLADAGALGFSSSSPFAPKSTVGERSYADYDPLSAVAFTDMSGGTGQDRATDVTRYYDAHNVDARGGRLVLGPLINAVASPVSLAAHAGGLLDGTHGTVGTLDYLSVDSTRTKVAASFTTDSTVTTIGRLWLPIKASIAAAAITVHIYNDASGEPGSSAGSATVSRDEMRQWGSWAEVIFSPALVVVPSTKYWVSVEHAGTTADSVRWYGGTSSEAAYAAYANAKEYDGAAWVAPTDYWHMIFWFEDAQDLPSAPLDFVLGTGEDSIARLWATAGLRLYYIAADGTPTVVEDGGGNPYETAATIVDALWFRASGDSHAYLFLALGDDTDYVKFDGNVGTEQWAAVASIQARKLTQHDEMIWRCDSRVSVSGSLDGTTYGNAVSVGDAAYPVRNMLSWAGNLYVGKDDGLYKVEYAAAYPTSETPTITKVLDFGSQVDSNNFRVMVDHQGDLIFSMGPGLLKFTAGGVLTPITPDTGLDLAIPERAFYKAAFSSLNVLWALAEGPLGGDSTLLAYVDYHWHPIATLPRSGDMARSVWVEPGLYADNPRVWLSAGLQTCYLNMPTTTQRRWLWSGMDWATSGYVDLSWTDGNIRTINKDWIQVELDVRDVGAGAGEPYVEVWWRPDEETAWAQVGAAIESTGISTVAFGASTYGPKAQLRVYLYRGTLSGAVTTPQVEAVVMKYMERPADLRTFSRSYVLSSRLAMRSGGLVGLSLGGQVGVLETLRESAEPLTWYPWWGSGASYSVHIIDYNATEVRDQEGPQEDVGEIFVNVRLQEV